MHSVSNFSMETMWMIYDDAVHFSKLIFDGFTYWLFVTMSYFDGQPFELE